MSYQTWHIYGYGICVSDITRCTVERLENCLHWLRIIKSACTNGSWTVKLPNQTLKII